LKRNPFIRGVILACFSPNGTIDLSFGNNGVAQGIPCCSSQGAGSTVTLQPDEKIVVAGGEIIERFDQHGALDSKFGSGGISLQQSHLV